MSGKKQTNKALQPEWQGTLRPADATHQTNQPRPLIIGIGEHSNHTITHLTKINTTTTPTAIITTNPQQLDNSKALHKILIDTTQPHTTAHKIETILDQTNILFLTTSLENDIESKIASITTQVAQKKGITIVGVVTPLSQNRENQTKLLKFKQQWDTTILIDDKILPQQLRQIPTEEAKHISQQISATIIKNMIEVLSNPKEHNLNLNTCRTLFEKSGNALVGIGESTILSHAEEAAYNTLHNTLPNLNPTIASHAIVHVTSDRPITTEEVNHLRNYITEITRSNSLVWGTNVDPELNGKFRVTLILTGINPPNTTNLSTITPQLYNLEPNSTPEKQLPIDLNLHQLENF